LRKGYAENAVNHEERMELVCSAGNAPTKPMRKNGSERQAGKPDIEIDTSIDYEVVIIQRRI